MTKLKNFRNNFNTNTIIQMIKKYGTPIWIYNENIIQKKIFELKSFDKIRFAQKSCSNINILKIMKKAGIFIDAVSQGEIERALIAGFQPKEIIFTADIFDSNTLLRIIHLNITVNIGSIDMLEQLGSLSPNHSIWLRINPKFGDGHHNKTNTGGENSKHGIWNINQAIKTIKKYNFKIIGIHIHIGSGINGKNIKKTCQAMIDTIYNLPYDIKWISTGGGLPIPYKTEDKTIDIQNYFNLWDSTRKKIQKYLGHEVLIEHEPGRFLVAESGILISEVRAIKYMGLKHYTLINAGFNDLVRPTMYGSYHYISIIDKNTKKIKFSDPIETIIGGPLCESGDIFTQNNNIPITRLLPKPSVGDYLIFHDTGAYGASMSSNYNSRPLIPEILFKKNSIKLIRRKQTFKEMFQLELN
ncbi:Diaminopimelate decarboxylase [Buchnera aphidicola (Eriosoma grossulariae)]|uniref:diaminopimelate decarboxylase n=1 Tax=Buchnera aphidicola TaxID=9 RepID=UPI003464B57A